MSSSPSTSQRLAQARSLIDTAREVSRDIGVALGQSSDVAMRAALHDMEVGLAIMIAEAQIELGQPQEALATLENIERGVAGEGSHLAELLRARIAARRAAGSGDSIQDEVNRLMEISPATAGSVIASSLQSYRQELEDLVRNNRDDDARALAIGELLPLARSLEQWMKVNDPSTAEADSMSRQIADSYRLAEQWKDALATYDRIARRHPDALDVLFGQAECLFHLGGEVNLGEAMKLYKRISASRSEDGDRYFWSSELRMLQILDEIGRNVQQIAPRIDRLRLRDPELGGERLRHEFDRLRSAHDR